MAARKKNCGAPECSERIKMRHSYCEKHFSLLPRQIRSDMIEARRIGDGRKVLDASKRAIEFYENYKEREVTTGKSDIVDVTLESRGLSDSGKAKAFWQGDYKELNNGEEREVWIWLPLSQIEIDEQKDGTCVVSMPEWLAMDKGLI